MMRSAIRMFRSLSLCALAILLATSATAESGGFVSSAGLFDFMSPPAIQPRKDVSPSDGWEGIFYAPGVGLEMTIWDAQDGSEMLHWSLKNYSDPNETALVDMLSCMSPIDGGMRDTSNGFTLRGLQDGSFTMELSESWLDWLEHRGSPVYGGASSVVFTDAAKLMAAPAEDRFGGAYFFDVMEDYGETQVYADETHYLSFVQLYGTRDYYLVCQCERGGRERPDAMRTLFLTESDGALIHNYGYSVVTETDSIERYEFSDSGPQKTVTQYAGDDGTACDYFWCSAKPMWKDR